MPNATALTAIADADTPAKVWALVLALTSDANCYTDATYLQNIKDYATLALK